MADPRVAAVGNVLAVLDGRSLDAALADMPASLAVRDRALAAELSYGVCRWYRRLDTLVGQLLAKPLKSRDRDVRVLLLVGAYQLLHSRVPPHAALATTVEASRHLGKGWASRLVNGVLRRLQREHAELAKGVDADAAVRYALPDWLHDQVVTAWPAHHEHLCAAWQQRPPMTLRVDLQRIKRADYAARLGAAGIAASPHATVSQALVLDAPVAVERLPDFDVGLVSVQDAGAQLAAAYLGAQSGDRVLDACAAPGGKTLDILQRTPDVELTALDIDAQRLARVEANLLRAGVRADLVVGDASRPDDAPWGQGLYDRILVDAPCSATGVMRRHPDIRLLRRSTDIAPLVRRQAAILRALWPMLRPGGRLLYVTCSVLPEENEHQVAAFLAAEKDVHATRLPETPGRRGINGVQLLPGIDDADGFFYAALDKPASAAS